MITQCVINNGWVICGDVCELLVMFDDFWWIFRDFQGGPERGKVVRGG